MTHETRLRDRLGLMGSKRFLILVGFLVVVSAAFLVDRAGDQSWIMTALGYRDERLPEPEAVLNYLNNKTISPSDPKAPPADLETTIVLSKERIRWLTLRPDKPEHTRATFWVRTDRGWYEIETSFYSQNLIGEFSYFDPIVLRVTRR